MVLEEEDKESDCCCYFGKPINPHWPFCTSANFSNVWHFQRPKRESLVWMYLPRNGASRWMSTSVLVEWWWWPLVLPLELLPFRRRLLPLLLPPPPPPPRSSASSRSLALIRCTSSLSPGDLMRLHNQDWQFSWLEMALWEEWKWWH